MKIFHLLVLLLFFGAQSVSAEKYALIIAIGDYPSSGGWPDISSENDIIHVKESLRILGFNAQNITLLQDSEANKVVIVKTLEELSEKLKAGDIVFIHFSGHGQQVLDDNGDEIDLLDEAIVPYDSPLTYIEGVYEGQNLIRDDLLGALTTKMRAKCGKDGQVILVLDSCHSGSGTRGLSKTRGTDKIMAPANFKTAANVTEKKMGIVVSNDENLSPMASFFAASSRELNYETLDDQSRPVGSLSYCIYSILADMKRSYSFNELFERVRLKMKTSAPRQNPQWEGPHDVLFLGGQNESENILYSVKEIIDPQKVRIEVGTLSGVFEGTTIEIISLDQDKAMCTGIVTSALLSEAVVTLDAELTLAKYELIKAKVLEKALPPIQCILVNNIATDSYWSPMVQRVVNEPIVKLATVNAELFLSESPSDNSLQLMTNEGTVLYSKKKSDPKVNLTEIELKKILAAFAQGKFIRSFETEHSLYNFEIEVVAVDPHNPQKVLKTYNTSTEVKIETGASVRFKISNVGNKSAFFSLLDIQPDNLINLVIPAVSYGYTTDEYFLEPGESYTTDYIIEISEPLGQETLKLICSKTPMDLSAIINNNGNATRGASQKLNTFEQLLSASYSGTSTRGIKIKSSDDNEFGVRTLYFEIVD